MNHRSGKSAVSGVCAACVMALLCCTVLSSRIEVWMLPQVRTQRVTQSVKVDEEGLCALPLASLQTDESGLPFVYGVEEVDGIWGKELRVEPVALPILQTYTTETEVRTSPEGLYNQRVVVASTKPLKPGDRVQEAAS